MELFQDGVLAFFAAVGLTACVYLVAGSLLGGKCRNPRVRILLPLQGDAPELEADLRELLRLRSALPLATIVLVDCGMSPAARERAEYFCQRRPRLELKTEEAALEQVAGERKGNTDGRTLLSGRHHT